MRTSDPVIHLVTRRTYLAHMGAARAESPLVRQNTCTMAELLAYPESTTSYFLSPDRKSGFMIHRGKLIGLFSLVRGRGASLVSTAIAAGARSLECYDGYLPVLYGRHGFIETDRVSTWTEGGPDVVVMARRSN